MYGLTIKKIRHGKGLTQKDVCTGIVTSSYYSRIERDVSLPTIEVFLKILQTLDVTFDEFMYIHRGYTESWENKLWFNITELYHTNDIEGLEQTKTMLLKRKNKISELYVDVVEIFIMRLSNIFSTRHQAEKLIKRLMRIEDWTSSEVKIFISLMDQISMETLFTIVNRLLKTKKLYTSSKGYNSYYNKILINTILMCIENRDVSNEWYYLTKLKDNLEVRDMYSKNMCLYFEGIFFYLSGNIEIGEEKIEQAFCIWKTLDMEDFSKKYESYFENLKSSV
ncbi:helix-turn-helix domain-containing protein [Enterococcus sp. LJL51]|uniref:helix-turn-helix domain-containing protein n=1 Tax=Enterococcus sp. LJL51 TaxID=3416656 RepID=UPI003CED139D